MRSGKFLSVTTAYLLFLACYANAQQSYSPYVGKNHPMNVYWGDTHLHTSLSMDAYGWGGNRLLGLDEAYRFARGEPVTLNNGQLAKLRRPLDFMVAADHAENAGAFVMLADKNPILTETETGRYLLDKMLSIEGKTGDTTKDWFALTAELMGSDLANNKTFVRSVWEQVTATADKYNRPGRFTAFIGYEWTSGNIHRVVVFKDDAETANKVLPFSALDSAKPEDLWAYLQQYQEQTDGEVLAIPHNSNLSGGEMFKLTDSHGRAFTQVYAKNRSRWEPLVEVTQTKGNSETHPLLSPDDEFADYEIWNDWTGRGKDSQEQKDSKRYEYVRSALKLGLEQRAELGANPFKFGLVGGTDAHTGIPAVDENNFQGVSATTEPRANRAMDKLLPFSPVITVGVSETAAAGYTGVWATENTREALFAAMKRKEVYATTGPRMAVRFFGGWHYLPDDAYRPDIAQTGYEKGVPMGGDLTMPPKDKVPGFLIRAVKDPDGANLDKVQVVKGWLDKNGEAHEKIYDVALSDNGKARNTVDIANATYTNTIGSPELAVVWNDPDFNPDESSFYYARVLEIPTPRWTAYDAKRFNAELPENTPVVIQERAYTSPIWYTPK